MFGTKQTQGGIVEAVAAARDEALVEIGREAAVRQELRLAKARRVKTGTFAAAAVAAGAALAAGAVMYRVRKRRNGKETPAIGADPAMTNGTTSEHEHAEEPGEDLVPSKR